MAAVRAGAVGFSRGSRYLVFTPAREWNDREREENHRDPRQPRDESKGRGYGVSTTSPETARIRWKLRKRMIDLKLCLCDWTMVLAFVGLGLAMIDVEVCAAHYGEDVPILSIISNLLRMAIVGSTAILLVVLLSYHIADAKIYLIETGSDNWRVGISSDRILKALLELTICAICPFPVFDTGTISWPLLGQNFTTRRFEMPVNILLSLPMFLRMFIWARYTVMHSVHYQDCATRTIASLNHISVDFLFVVKSSLYQRPLYMLSWFTGIFWITVAWMITQCERFAFDSIPGYQHFLDFIWFVIITFFSIGYGDVQVHSYCGRALAMLTAIVGTLFASILIALVGRRMALSSSEKRVNHLIAESQLTIQHKNAAARVLQNTWRTVLRRREESSDHSKSLRLRYSQRKLLSAILNFRKSRWRLRLQMEEEDDFFTARKAFLETEERLSRVRKRQAQLNAQMTVLYEHVQTLTSIIQ